MSDQEPRSQRVDELAAEYGIPRHEADRLLENMTEQDGQNQEL